MTIALSRRLLSKKSTEKPEWMVQAELDAIAATNSRAGAGANDVMMNKLTHELQGERVSSMVKMEDKLKRLIAKCTSLHSDDTTFDSPEGRKLYSAIRKQCLDDRQNLITQREASGMTKDAAVVVETMYVIPPAV